MSRETLQALNTNTLIGFTDKRGEAWHYRAEKQGRESNHYKGAVPISAVRKRLFGWQGVEAPVSYTLPDGRTITDETRKVIARSDTGAALGVFRDSYVIHQYDEWLIRNVEAILDASLAVGSAGLLKGGAVAWVQVEMEDTISTPQGVEFRPFLTAATSMDGSLASTYQTGAQVVVCDNTLSAALGEVTSRIRVKHSKRSMGRIGDVREALNIVHGTADAFAAQVAALCEQAITDKQFADIVALYTAPSDPESKNGQTIQERRTDELGSLWANDERVSPWRGTAYGVLAAINTHTHHVATVRGASRAERNAERMVSGDVDKMDAGTMALIQQVLSAA